jgi:hypothetical protein
MSMPTRLSRLDAITWQRFRRHTNKLAEAVESETETTFSRERQRLGVKMAQLRAETVQARGMAKRTDTRSPGTAIQRRKKL